MPASFRLPATFFWWLAAFLWVVTNGQRMDAVCTISAYNWLENSKGQSPCFVAKSLLAQCDPTRANVSALEPGGLDYYPGPDAAIGFFPTNCTCNTIMYSLLSACSVCQGYVYIEWSRWRTNCRSVYITQYPLPLPAAVSVPAWAYLNVAAHNNFSLPDAASVTLPDISSTSSTEPAVPLVPTATSPPATGPVVTQGPAPNDIGSSSSNFLRSLATTVIVPSVIGGGLVVTALIGFGLKFYGRWKSKRVAPSATVRAAGIVDTAERGETPRPLGAETRARMAAEARSASTFQPLAMPPIPEDEGSEIQLVPRSGADNDPGPSTQTGQNSSRRASFYVPRDQPGAGPSQIQFNS